MTDNLNINLYEFDNTIEKCKRDSAGDMVPFYEEITVTKTEVKEESYDVEMSIDDVVFTEIKEEPPYSPEILFVEEELGLTNHTERLLNENPVFEKCEFKEADQYKRDFTLHSNCGEELVNQHEQCHSSTEQKLSKTNLRLNRNRAKQKNTLKNCMLAMNSKEPNEYNCSHCKFVAKTKQVLKIHLRIHNNEKPFKCTFKICKCTPGQEDSCECDICGYAATQKHHLKTHVLSKHSEKSKVYMCKDCKYVTYLKTALKQHILTHDRLFKCKYKNCNCTAEQRESCKCNMCRFATNYKSDLTKHILVRHSENPKKYRCKDCKYFTYLRSSLIHHVFTHTNDRPFKCTYKNCRCTPEQEEPCKCDTCGYAGKREDGLKTHILLMHSNKPKEYMCEYCSYATHLKVCLIKHIRTHTSDKPFKCTYKTCNCTPKQKESCKCNMCTFASNYKTSLTEHILLTHSEEPKKYKCKNCPYAAHKKGRLMQHIRTHTSDKLFKCTYKTCNCTPEQKESCKCNMCTFASKYKTSLRKHILVRHSEGPKKYNWNNCLSVAQKVVLTSSLPST